MPMSPWRLSRGLGADILQPGREVDFTQVGIDTRQLPAGALFVALQGRRNGEDWFGDALGAGARALAGRRFNAAVRREARRRGAWLFRVADGRAALQRLAEDQRLLMGGVRIAITGSNGKTGAKDLLACLLAGEGPVLASRGNFNNQLGVPLTLLRARPGVRYSVLEAGMNHAGELRSLGRLIRPHVVVELNVGLAHAGRLGGRRADVARAKAELLESLDDAGTAVLNADDSYTRAMARRHRGRSVFFGRSEEAHLRLERVRDEGARGLRAVARWRPPEGGRVLRLPVRLIQGGPARQVQVAAALAVALSLGAEPRRLLRRLAGWHPFASLRQEVRSLGAAHAVLDCYNASPQSLQAGLDFLALSAPAGRRLGVLGSMLELGPKAPALHRAAGRAARRAGLRALVALGPYARELAEGFGRDAAAFHQDEVGRAALWLAERLEAGDWVLFKGSRAMAVERVYDALTGA